MAWRLILRAFDEHCDAGLRVALVGVNPLGSERLGDFFDSRSRMGRRQLPPSFECLRES